MDEKDTTNIRIAESTADDLHDRKNRGESYDDVIKRLLDEVPDGSQ